MPTLRQRHEDPRKNSQLAPQLWELPWDTGERATSCWLPALGQGREGLILSVFPLKNNPRENKGLVRGCPTRHSSPGTESSASGPSRDHVVYTWGGVEVPLDPEGDSLNQPYQNACCEQDVNTALRTTSPAWQMPHAWLATLECELLGARSGGHHK